MFAVAEESSKSVNASDELFKKAFGKKPKAERISLPLFLKDQYISELELDVLGSKILGFPASGLYQSLKNILLDQELKRIADTKKEYLTPEDLSFQLNYSEKDLMVFLEAPEALIRPRPQLFSEGMIPYFSKEAKLPAPFSGVVNVKADQTFYHQNNFSDFLNANINSFFNFKETSLENNLQYSSDRSVNKWYRNSTTIVKDDEQNATRYSLGDTQSQISGYLVSEPILGLSVAKDYSITPYRTNTTGVGQEYSVETRSIVRYFVNNNLLKTEFLSPGKYQLKDLPLNNGVNKIIIEVEDEFGNKKYFNFKQSYSNELLKKNEVKFDFSAGRPSIDQNYQKKYDDNFYLSGFFKRGWTDVYTSGTFASFYKKFNLFGFENLLSTSVGNFGLNLGRSAHDNYDGLAYNMNYGLNFYSQTLKKHQNLNLRLEKRDRYFSEGKIFSMGRFKYNANSNYSIPLTDWTSLGMGLNYSRPFDLNYAEKYGYDLSINNRILNSTSLTFYFSNTRDEYKKKSQLFYIYLNYIFESGSSYASSYYDSSSKTKRLSVFHDANRAIDNIKISSQVEDSKYVKNGEVDFVYSSKYSDFGIRENVIKNKYSKSQFQTNVRVLSAFSFAYDDGFRSGLSRPINNSFAIIAGNDLLKNEKVGLKTSGHRIVEDKGVFNEIVVRDLIPYQYRRLQVDPSQLKEGYTLNQESFIVYPKYKAGHLLKLDAIGTVSLKGRIVGENKTPQGLSVGEVLAANGKRLPFFTNKQGFFYIEGLNFGSVKILWGEESKLIKDVTISEGQSGILDIGEISIE